MRSDTHHVALCGAFAFDNYGDQLFPLVLERALRRRLANVQVTPFAPAATAIPSDSRVRVNALHEMATCLPSGPDAFIIGGGDLLRTDVMPGWFPGYVGPFPAPTLFWLVPALLAAEMGVPSLWNAVGVPHAFAAEEAPLVRDACRLASYLSVRDPRSQALLHAAGVDREIAVVPDTGLLVSELFSADQLVQTWTSLFGTPPDPQTPTLCFHASPAFLENEFPVVVDQLTRLLSGTFQRIILLPICNLLGDHAALAKLKATLGEAAKLIDRPTGLQEVAACIWGSDAFVGTSLHGCITALAFHKPHLALARLGKLHGYMELIGRADCALAHWNDLAAASSLLSLDRAGPLAVLHGQLVQRIEAHFDRLAELIERARIASPVPSKPIYWGPLGPELCIEEAALARLQLWSVRTYQREVDAQAARIQALETELRLTRATALANAAIIERLQRDLQGEQTTRRDHVGSLGEEIQRLSTAWGVERGLSSAEKARLLAEIQELRVTQLPGWAQRVRRRLRYLAGRSAR